MTGRGNDVSFCVTRGLGICRCAKRKCSYMPAPFLIVYKVDSFPIIGALKYHYLGTGWCANYEYLPEGKYPPHLHPDQPGWHRDKLQECSQRCQLAYNGTKAFFVKRLADAELCACARRGDSCSSRKPGYEPYSSFSITG